MAGKPKLHRFSDVEYKDRLSGLPDEILICSILSRLPMKEAARTSILSHRWKFLWSSVPCLDFDALEDLTRKGITMDDPSLCKGGEAASKFVRWVDGAIGAYRGLGTLRYFRLRFHLYYTLSDEIDSWLMFALGEQGVEVLELDCCWDFGFESPRCKYRLENLSFPNLRLLKSLTLRGLTITDYYLEYLLLGCAESLETLQLQSLQSLTRVNVTGPVSKLKHIHILNCYYVRSIMISAPTPDLVSFIYPGWVDPLHLEHAPRLVDLFICQNTKNLEDFDLISHPLFRYISHLQTLHLEASSWHMVTHWLPHLPDLTGLKHLKLTLGGFDGSRASLHEQMLRGLASLMEAARCVQHITLECGFGRKVEIREEFANLHLEHLRVIEIVGFLGRKSECELALQLVQAAAVSQLEKLIIDCRDPLRRGFIPSDYAIPQRTTRKWKKRARKLIQPMLPSKVKLVLI